MAKDTANGVAFWLEIDQTQKHFLGNIRHWENLKMATEGHLIWVSNFSQSQIESKEVKSIPFTKVYQQKENKLFPYGSVLPERKAPLDLLWTPIRRALSIEFPTLNHNYFGQEEKLEVILVPTSVEVKPIAMRVDLKSLGAYLEKAPAIRLTPLTWVLLEENEALIFGTPMLPLPGDVYWRAGDFLIPAGMNFKYHGLNSVLNKKINSDKTNYILWDKTAHYFKINKEKFKALSLSAFRLSVTNNQSS